MERRAVTPAAVARGRRAGALGRQPRPGRHCHSPAYRDCRNGAGCGGSGARVTVVVQGRHALSYY